MKSNVHMQNINEQRVTERFFADADAVVAEAKNKRRCKTLPDGEWIRLGARRVLSDVRSGRQFLQKWNLQEGTEIGVVHYFETASSARRLRLVDEVNESVASAMPEHARSGFADCEDFDKFEIYAGDGVYIGASAHEKSVQGKKPSARAFLHAEFAHPGDDAFERFRLGKRNEKGRARHARAQAGRGQGAATRRAWDPAGIDIDMWGYWKQQYGVYFLSWAKDNMGFIEGGELNWYRDDPVNAGVVSDTRVTTLTSDVTLRRIVYADPKSGDHYEFITTETTIRPGLLAWVYKCRWEIEKTYDTFKNKLGQTTAWGRSDEAKNMQARFVCLAHNLMVLFETLIGVDDEKEIERSAKRYRHDEIQAEQRNATFARQYHNPRKRTQIAAKFIRWLRHCLAFNWSMNDAIHSLRRVYAIF